MKNKNLESFRTFDKYYHIRKTNLNILKMEPYPRYFFSLVYGGFDERRYGAALSHSVVVDAEPMTFHYYFGSTSWMSLLCYAII